MVRFLPQWSAVLALVLWALGCAGRVYGQTPLTLVNEQTAVRAISFKFQSTQTFEVDRLKLQIATTEPGFWDRLKRVLPLLDPAPHPFGPVELQKDVVRLRNFYNNNGFLHPEIMYGASQLDTASNTIHIIFAIEEGPPLVIQDVGFLGADSAYAFYQFPEARRSRWTDFREKVTVRTGDRYTEFDRIRIQDETLSWLKNQGYAFAQVSAEADIDSTANTADLRFFIDPGPVAYFDNVQVEGTRSVDRSVILRELPFRTGQVFSNDKLVQGQRELFSLNLFRLALTEVPDQPRDSTVDVRIRLREARLRYMTAQTGYSRENGISLQGEWSHRNFLGEARTFSATAVANSGFLANPSGQVLTSRLFRAGVSLRQPYLFTTKLSGIVAPFGQFERDPQLLESEETLGINTREFGVNTTLLYEFYPFRTLSLQHTFSRALQLTAPRAGVERTRDLFNKSVFSLSGLFGKAGNFLNPSHGYLVRPFAELGGAFLGSDVEYFKLGTEATGYAPVTDRFNVAARLYAGRIWPFGRSEGVLLGIGTGADSLGSSFENRFDPIVFYAGGSNDLRGWGSKLAGDKEPRLLTTGSAARYTFEPVGGTAKLGANLELRMPFPGLGSAWTTAAFLDAGMVAERLNSLEKMRFGTGAGLRYESIIGFVRLDLAYKLNPSDEDLRKLSDLYEYETNPGTPFPEAKWYRRFNLHLSIGQAF